MTRARRRALRVTQTKPFVGDSSQILLRMKTTLAIELDEIDPAVLEVLTVQQCDIEGLAARKEAPITLADITHPPIPVRVQQKKKEKPRKSSAMTKSCKPCDQPAEHTTSKSEHPPSLSVRVVEANLSTIPKPQGVHDQNATLATQPAKPKLHHQKSLIENGPSSQHQPSRPSLTNSYGVPRSPAGKGSKRSQWAKPPPTLRTKKKPVVDDAVSSSSGGWTRLPPTEEVCLTKPETNWSCREPMRMSMTVSAVLRWVGAVERELRDVGREVRMHEYRLYINTPMSDLDMVDFDAEYWSRSIVPEYWQPDRVGHQSPQMYWKELNESKLPPADEGDLLNVKPWWVDFPPFGAPLAQMYPQPELCGVDPDETQSEKAAREADEGSTHAIEPYFAEKRRLEKLEKRNKRNGRDDVLW